MTSQAECSRRLGPAALATLTLGMLVAPGAARAQMRGGGMPVTPVATALDKVPVGTWAEYSVKRGDGPARKLRQALVGKEAGAYVVETRSESQNGDRILARAVLEADPSKEGGVKKSVVQIGNADPMEMPAARPPGARPDGDGPGGGGGPGERRGGMRGARYLKPDPKTLVGKETIKVAAGSFPTEHYRTEGPRGGTVDYWVSRDVGPFGLVKLQMVRPAGDGGGGDQGGRGDGGGSGPVMVELAARGKGAKPEITKAAKPFDPAALPDFMRGRGDGAGAR
jgi:hypothetical protein